MNTYKVLFRIACFLNISTLFLPWWSKFEIYDRMHSDAFLFGILKYYVDPPPAVWAYPSSKATLLFETWSNIYLPFMLIIIILVCVGSFCYFKASMMNSVTHYLGSIGCLFSVVALLSFIFSITTFNGSLGFVGAISAPSWVDWGPDIGFFLMLFSTTLSLIGLFIATKDLRIRIRL